MSSLKFYDLSLPIAQGMPYFKGDPIPEVRQFRSIESDGYNVKEMKIGTHTGTHLDAPAHFIEGGKTVDQLDLMDLSGRATCIAYDPGERMRLPNEHFDIILLYTGYNNRWNEIEVFEKFSYIDKNDAENLRTYGIKLVGIDSPSAEIENSKNFDTHHILLGSSIPIIENLNSAILSRLVNHTFTIQVIPILVKDGDGAPARVIAMEA
jgi:arylformamidase